MMVYKRLLLYGSLLRRGAVGCGLGCALFLMMGSSPALAAHYFGGEIVHELLGPLGGTGPRATHIVVKATMRIYLDRSRFCNRPADGRGSCCSGTCLNTSNPRRLFGEGTFRWGSGGRGHPTLSPGNRQTNNSFTATPWTVIYEDKPGNLLGFEFVTYRIYPPTTQSTTAEWSDCCWSNSALPMASNNGYDLKTDIAFTAGNHSPHFNGAFFANGCQQYDLNFDLQPSDRDGDAVTVSFYQPKAGGAQTQGLMLSPQGVLSWPKGSIKVGLWIVRVQVKDSKGATSVREFLLDIAAQTACNNRPPTVKATPDAVSVSIGQQACTSVEMRDPDAADKLRVQITPAKPNVTVTPATATQPNQNNPTTFQYCWTPAASDEDTDHNIQFTVYDNGSPQLNAQKIFKIKVQKGMPPAIALTPAGAQKTVVATQTITFQAKATDKETAIASFTATAPPWCIVTKSGDTLSFSCTPPRSEGGKTFDIVLTAKDSDGKPKTTVLTVKLQVTVYNRPPAVTNPGAQTLPHGVPYSLTVAATDPDNDKLTFGLSGLPTGAAIDAATGKISWTPNAADIGNHTATVKVDDGFAGGAVTITIPFTVTNGPPVISGTPAAMAYVGEAFSYAPQATDPNPGDTIKWSLTGLAGASMDATTGKLSWTPAAADLGKQFTATVEACDPQNACGSQSFPVSVGQKCTFDNDCGLNWLCVQRGTLRLCIPPGCADSNTPCTQGQLCDVATCAPAKCQGVTCAANEFCDPSNGACISACPTCPGGQRCSTSRVCEPDPCDGKQCPSGERCVDGTCQQDACVGRSGVCRFGRLCIDSQCVDDPCTKVQCDGALICKAGRCYAPAPEPPPEPEPVVEPTPEPTVEPTPEPEPVVEPTPEPDASVQPEPEPVVEMVPEPVAEPSPEPTPEPIVEVMGEAGADGPPLAIRGGGCSCAATHAPSGSFWLWLLLIGLCGAFLRRNASA